LLRLANQKPIGQFRTYLPRPRQLDHFYDGGLPVGFRVPDCLELDLSPRPDLGTSGFRVG
jgi:hypothetical protein